MSFIRFGRISCFPEFLKKMSDCEYTWRISFRNVNDESSLSLVTNFNSKYAFTIFTLSFTVYCFRSIGVRIQCFVVSIFENKKKSILEIARIQSGNILLAHPV